MLHILYRLHFCTESEQIKHTDVQNYSSATSVVQKQENLNLFCGAYHHSSTDKWRPVTSDSILVKKVTWKVYIKWVMDMRFQVTKVNLYGMSYLVINTKSI